MNHFKDEVIEKTWEDFFFDQVDNIEERLDRTLDLVEVFNINIQSISSSN